MWAACNCGCAPCISVWKQIRDCPCVLGSNYLKQKLPAVSAVVGCGMHAHHARTCQPPLVACSINVGEQGCGALWYLCLVPGRLRETVKAAGDSVWASLCARVFILAYMYPACFFHVMPWAWNVTDKACHASPVSHAQRMGKLLKICVWHMKTVWKSKDTPHDILDLRRIFLRGRRYRDCQRHHPGTGKSGDWAHVGSHAFGAFNREELFQIHDEYTGT
jgi:hypothetical protein